MNIIWNRKGLYLVWEADYHVPAWAYRLTVTKCLPAFLRPRLVHWYGYDNALTWSSYNG